MSIDKMTERGKPKSVNISGSRADLEALASVLDTGAKRINADIYPDEKDIPGRISLKTGTVLQITRVRKAMKDIANGLREEGKGIEVDFGMLDVRDRPAQDKEEWLGVMDAVTAARAGLASTGYASAAGLDVTGPEVVDTLIRNVFEERTYGEGGPGDKGFLRGMNIRWVHAEPLITPETEVRGRKIKKPSDMVGIDQYPAKFNTKKISAWAKEQGINRGYIVIAEVDRFPPLTARIYSKPGKWREWLHKMPAGKAIMPSYEDRPPKTVGDVLERISVYATGRAFDLENARVVPFDLGLIDKKGLDSHHKIRTWRNVLSKAKTERKEEVPMYRNYFGFLVVGRGPYKPLGLTRVKEEP
jgi:hypothetical protein